MSISLSSSLAMKRRLPEVQNFIAGLAIAGTVGIYIFIASMGAGSQHADFAFMNGIVQTTFNSIFAVTGFFGASLVNFNGPKWSVFCGALGYPFYVSGFFYFDYRDEIWYPILGAVVLGICAGQIWSGANYIALVYADEDHKGRFYSTQASMKAMGNVIVNAVCFGIDFDRNENLGPPLAVYLSFISLMIVTISGSLLLVKPRDVRRKDGTAITGLVEETSFLVELKAVMNLIYDSKALLLIPCLFVAQFQPIVQNLILDEFFNIRTRRLTQFIASIIEVFATIGFGNILDYEGWTRPQRAKVGFYIIATLTIATFSGQAGWMYSAISQKEPQDAPLHDFTSSFFAGYFLLYILFNTLNACIPEYFAWVLAALANNPRQSGIYAGLLRSIIAAGTAVGFGMSVAKVDVRRQFIACFACQSLALLPQAWISWRYVTETSEETETSDEKMDGAISAKDEEDPFQQKGATIYEDES